MPNYFDEVHRIEIINLNQTIASQTEWPTWMLLVGFYFIFIAVIFGNLLGEVATIALLIPMVVLWISIQHELIHGHPTPWAKVNKMLGYCPLAVWYPYALYRDTHLAHHHNETLTFPVQDPESRYVSNACWKSSSRLKRGLLWINKTLAGRLIVGAPLGIFELLVSEYRKLRNGVGDWAMWCAHLLSVAMVLMAIEHFSAISAMQYVLLVSLPALSIAMIRSFYEHRPSPIPEHRTVIVESSGPLSWMFLHLNLHLVHHDLPGLPWFYLPRVYRARRAQWIARNNGFVIRGYRALFRTHLATPIDSPVHPDK